MVKALISNDRLFPFSIYTNSNVGLGNKVTLSAFKLIQCQIKAKNGNYSPNKKEFDFSLFYHACPGRPGK